MHAGIPPPPNQAQPQDQAGNPPGPGTPHLPDQVPTPRSRSCWGIRSTSGRYASYWNVMLLVLILRHLFLSVHRPAHCFHSMKVTCLTFCTGVNGDELTDCTISGSSDTVSVQVQHEVVDNRNISGRDNNRAVSPVPQDVSKTVTLGTNNYSRGSNTAFIELSTSTSSSHQPSPTEHCVNICCEADQTCNRSIALALTPTTTTSNKVEATGCVQSIEEEKTCAGGGCREWR